MAAGLGFAYGLGDAMTGRSGFLPLYLLALLSVGGAWAFVKELAGQVPTVRILLAQLWARAAKNVFLRRLVLCAVAGHLLYFLIPLVGVITGGGGFSYLFLHQIGRRRSRPPALGSPLGGRRGGGLHCSLPLSGGPTIWVTLTAWATSWTACCSMPRTSWVWPGPSCFSSISNMVQVCACVSFLTAYYLGALAIGNSVFWWAPGATL